MPLDVGEETSIDNPPAGIGRLAPKTDEKLYFRNSSGTETQLTELGTITGARDNPEAALANLLTALENAGLIVDSTTAS